MNKPINIVSFGGGVNSTALIIEMIRRNVKIDYIIFADTGSEMPETYEHIEIMKKWFKDHNLAFIVVKSKLGSVYDHYFNKKTIPYRKFRSCTDKFKIRPITKWVKKFKGRGVIQNIGISIEERNRQFKTRLSWVKFEFPLIKWKINRKSCINIIQNEGLSVPIKSGCFMCPFQSNNSWKLLYSKHNELFKKSIELEQNSIKYPINTLRYRGNLTDLKRSIEDQTTITDFNCGLKNKCGGYCFI